jgi:2-phosphoglycerate kinase
VTTQFDLGALGWRILPLGGASGIGKSTVAMRLGQRLGVPWLQVDDFRLEFERSGVPSPDSALAPNFDGPGSLVEVGTSLSSAIEVVIENHVDQRNPAVFEGDGILPALLECPSVRHRAESGWVRVIFLYEPEERVIHQNMQTRMAGRIDTAHARKNWQYSEWLRREAERRDLPTLPVRPWDTLEDRILAAAQASLILRAAFHSPHAPGDRL